MDENVKRKIELIKNMPREKRILLCKKFIDKIISQINFNDPTSILKAIEIISSEDGAVIYPHFFKEEYRDLMIDIAYLTLSIYSNATIKLLSSIIKL